MKSINRLNYFSHPLTFNYNGSNYKTHYGGIVSLIVTIIALLYAIDKTIMSFYGPKLLTNEIVIQD